MKTEKTLATKELPKNSFECMAWVARHQSPKSATAMSVAFVLASFWNMDGKGECRPAIGTIMERTGWKKTAVKKAFLELEEAGEWVIIRNKAGVPNNYFPMFVQDARKDLKTDAGQQLLIRREADKQRKENAMARHEFEAGVDALVATADYSEFETESATLEGDPRIVTQRDQDILAQYLDIQTSKASDFDWIVPLPLEGRVVDFIDEDELSNFTQYGNPEKVFVAGAEDKCREEFAPVWVEKFGAKYGPAWTYSAVDDVYEELFHGTRPMDAHLADAAMYVLGSQGIAPEAKYIRFLAFAPEEKLDDGQLKLRSRISATAEGRRHTIKYSNMKHYEPLGTHTIAPHIPMDMPGRIYSDTL